MNASGIISTAAGTGIATGSIDGPGGNPAGCTYNPTITLGPPAAAIPALGPTGTVLLLITMLASGLWAGLRSGAR